MLERSDELSIMWHAALACDDGKHHLVGVISHAYDGVAQKAAALVFLIGGDMAGFCGACDSIENSAGAGRLDAAIGNADDPVGSTRKETRGNMIFAVRGKGGCRFMAKAAWRSDLSSVSGVGPHAAYGLDRAV